MSAIRQKLGVVVVLLLCVATWAFTHGYEGIRHDANLYTLQALARLSVGNLDQDVFLNLGSQDQYTVFGRFYALVIRGIGVEPAAAILTLVSQLALIVCAALLLRRVARTPALIGLGVALLIAIPGFYGADRVFRCIEPFVTPRMGAEALVLAGLAAAWSERPKLAWTLVALGMLVHPVMAAAGLVALGFLYVGSRRPLLTLGVISGGALLLMVSPSILPNGRWGTFDTAWLTPVNQRGPYLFLANWPIDDWGRAAVPLATLAIGALFLAERRARMLCQVTLCTALSGLLLSLVACDVAKLVLFTQLQPWRWQWLAVVIAALLIPAIVADGWRRSYVSKITLALLVAAWLFGSGEFALVASLVAVATLALEKFSARSEWRLLLYGALAFAILALANRIASNLLFLEVHFADPQIPLWVRETTVLVSDGSIPVALVLLAAWLANHVRGRAPLAIFAVLVAGTCVTLFPDAWRRWTQQQFPATLSAQFTPWKDLIPAGSNVFWSESPLSTWVLLDRPSYISAAQTAGILFSRASAMELVRRAEALRAVVPPQAYLSFSGDGATIGPSLLQLDRACATGEFEFLVTSARLPWHPIAHLPRTVWHSSGGLGLYRCADRGG
jgi:hypothetical protein